MIAVVVVIAAVVFVGHLERDQSGSDYLPYKEIKSSQNNSNCHKTTNIYILLKYCMLYDSTHEK